MVQKMKEVLYKQHDVKPSQQPDLDDATSTVPSSAAAMTRVPFNATEMGILEKETRALLTKGMFVTCSLVLSVMSRNSPHLDGRSPKCVENKMRIMLQEARGRESNNFMHDSECKRARRRKGL